MTRITFPPVVFLVFLLSGCGPYAFVSDEISSFDDSRTITVAVSALPDENGKWTSPIFLGATWREKYPDTIYLDMDYRSDYYDLVNFESLSIRIGDSILGPFETGDTQHHSSYGIYLSQTYSSASTFIPLSVFDKMLAADDCRLRFHTTDGYIDSLFSVGKRQVGGYYAKASLVKFRAGIPSD